MFKTLLLACLLFQCAATTGAQDSGGTPSCEERARRVLDTLPRDNDLRHALERGARGDCVHHPWMDELKRLGIKHVSFLVSYKITKKKVSMKVGKVYFLRAYYQRDDESRVSDKRLLRKIKESGLEARLREAASGLQREWADATQAEVRHRGITAEGDLEVTLLDDEALPRLDLIIN